MTLTTLTTKGSKIHSKILSSLLFFYLSVRDRIRADIHIHQSRRGFFFFRKEFTLYTRRVFPHERSAMQIESATSTYRNFNIHPFIRLLKLRNYKSIVASFCMTANWKAVQESCEYTARIWSTSFFFIWLTIDCTSTVSVLIYTSIFWKEYLFKNSLFRCDLRRLIEIIKKLPLFVFQVIPIHFGTSVYSKLIFCF